MKLLVAVSAGFLLLFGCVQPEANEINSAGNTPPKINSIVIDPVYITVGQTTTITVSADDSDGDQLNYEWNASIGDIIGEGAKVRYSAAFCCVGSNRVNISVNDGRGGEVEGFIDIFVNP